MKDDMGDSDPKKWKETAEKVVDILLDVTKKAAAVLFARILWAAFE